MKLKTLIADDEPLASERLRFLLASDEDIDLSGQCRNAREVIAHLKSKQIDLLFLDIQMPGKNAFDVFTELGPACMPLTVFVTAYHQYAIKAFDVHALDYLTKPIEPARLKSTLDLVKERLLSKAAVTTHDALASVLATLESKNPAAVKFPKRLLIPNGSKNSFVAVNDIEWIEAADYYCCLHVGKCTLLLREPIKRLETILDPQKFVRIHRSAVVNVEQVREILREGRGEGSVLLVNGQRLRMSKPGWQRLLAVGRH
jgi:two-component system LytT family response regulator